MDPTALTDAILHMKWLPLAILLMTYLTRLTADDSKFPVSIPARWHPVVVLVLGQVLAVLLAIQGGVKWWAAAVTGLVTSLVTMGLFDLLVKAVLGDKPWPGWLQVLALVFPPKKEDSPPTPKGAA